MTTAGQICNIEVVITTRDTTVADAAKLMRHRHVGSLVVADSDDAGKRPVGIVTDRDLVIEVLALDGDLACARMGAVQANGGQAAGRVTLVRRHSSVPGIESGSRE